MYHFSGRQPVGWRARERHCHVLLIGWNYATAVGCSFLDVQSQQSPPHVCHILKPTVIGVHLPDLLLHWHGRIKGRDGVGPSLSSWNQRNCQLQLTGLKSIGWHIMIENNSL